MLHARGTQVVDSAGKPVSLRCVNLSPWLNREPYLVTRSWLAIFKSPTEFERRLSELVGAQEAAAFWDAWESAFLKEEDFREFQAAGINCVRLPLNHSKISEVQPDGTLALREAGLAPVDRAVAWGEKFGVSVILNLHAVPGGQNDFPTASDVPSNDRVARFWKGSAAKGNQERAIALWKLLATRYAGAVSVGGYDLMNEPKLPTEVPSAALARVYSEMIDAIRSVDAQHLVILEGVDFAREFSTFPPPVDHNVMYAFHIYAIVDWSWHSPAQRLLQPYLDTRSCHGVPIWLGEFGEDRARWIEEMVQLMEANQVGWALWPWKRVSGGTGRPVLHEIQTTASWDRLAYYLADVIGAERPTVAEAKHAMAEMVNAAATSRCVHNDELRKLFSR